MVTRLPLKSKFQTGNEMKRLVNSYNNDISRIFYVKNGKYIPLHKLPLGRYFSLMASITYKKDSPPKEVVSRPYITLKNRLHGADCKKKGILIAAYLRKNKIPWRFIASSRKPNRRIHHVFPQAFLNGQWINVDATYPHYRLGQPKRVTNWVVL